MEKSNERTYLSFPTQQDFHDWLATNHADHAGIWLKFDKSKPATTLTAEEALDEALCFGWIDGVMQSLGEKFYAKYFTKRRTDSIWSTKNKNSVARLIEAGRMHGAGLEAVDKAKKDGRWERADNGPPDFSIDEFVNLIAHDELAHANFMKMSPSVKKVYVYSYYTLKKPESRARRLDVVIERLRKNLKPM